MSMTQKWDSNLPIENSSHLSQRKQDSQKQHQAHVDLFYWWDRNCSSEDCPPSSTAFYVKVLWHLVDAARKKWHDKWQKKDGSSTSHHDSAPAHYFMLTWWLFVNNNMIVMPHPLYLLDLPTCNVAICCFLHFRSWKWKLKKGYRFQTVKKIRAELYAILNMLE